MSQPSSIGRRSLPYSLLGLALLLGAPGWAQEPSLSMPLASKSLLLDGFAQGGLAVAVGERGHVLLSHDDGETWRQVVVPTRATLTGVFFHDEKLGWAVGHDAVILRTGDGGESWELLYSAPEEERPLFDVRFEDAHRGFAIGAYGLYLETEDGGDTWTPREIMPPEDEDDPYAYGIEVHLNQVQEAGAETLYVAAEAGTVYRSDDGGVTWRTLPSPYEGSFFGTLPLEGDALLLYGLRGHLFRSDDGGESWQAIPTATTAMLTDALRLDDGTVVVAGLAGTLLHSHDGGHTFVLAQQADRQAISAVLSAADGLVLIGEHGVRKVPMSVLDSNP